MRLKNTFAQGKLNKDIDERLVPKGQYVHAENIRMSNSESSDIGAIENVLGNEQASTLGLTNACTIGSYSDDSNQKIYWFVTSDTKDMIMEYNVLTSTVMSVLESTNPNGTLNFSKDNLITGINIIFNEDTDKNLLAWTDNLNPPRITNIQRAKGYGLDNFTEDDISVIKCPPLEAPTTTLQKLDIPDNNIKEKFLSFAYRYQYLDGEYSALSPFTYYQFSPKESNINFQTFENEGMVNDFNAVDIGFNTGSKNVTNVQIVVKESNSNNLYVVETLNKTSNGWADNSVENILFSNNKQYTVLPEDELFRQYDNVPLMALAQEVIGNRLLYANYLEGYDMTDINGNPVELDLEVSVNSVAPRSAELTYVQETNTRARLVASSSVALSGLLNQGGLLNFEISAEGVGNSTTPIVFSTQYTLDQDYANLFFLLDNPTFIEFQQRSFDEVFISEYLKSLPATWALVSVDTPTFIDHDSSDTIMIELPTITINQDGTNVQHTFSILEETNALFSTGGVTSPTLKSNRDYEVGIIYRDKCGRSSTVITSTNNTVHVPASASDLINTLEVTVKSPPPSWADSYKVVVKQSQGVYQTLYTSIFYEDGLFRWVKLEGDNKDKVKEGDILTIKADTREVKNELIQTKVIEIKEQDANFIDTNSTPEESGLYMKIKPEGFDLNATGNAFRDFRDENLLRYPVKSPTRPAFTEDGTSTGVPLRLEPGSRVGIEIRFDAGGSIQFFEEYIETFTVQGSYASVEDWFEAEVETLGTFGDNFTRGGKGVGYGFENNRFFVWSHRDGTASQDIRTTNVWKISFVEAIPIFETQPQVISENIFYETEETLKIINNLHEGNTQNQTPNLDAVSRIGFFNAYSQGNGAESYQVRDAFNSPFLNIDYRPTTTSVEGYKAARKFADITYSEPYNENTNINGLNEFNLSLANFKEDIDKRYGSIQKLFNRDTNLLVFQENKVSYVLFGKDLLVNADGTSNITSTESVLGQQVPYTGEWGISRNPESFAFDGFNIYFTDAKNGSVMRLGTNGLTEISNHGMRRWFKDQFRDAIDDKKYGAFDPYHDQYVLSVTNPDFTLTFDEKPKGWTSFHSYTPENMVGMNNRFFSFNNGDIYEHHSLNVGRNTYYNVFYPSKLSTVMNDDPSVIKELLNVSLEGNSPWETEALAYVDDRENFIRSTIAPVEYDQREGHWYAHARRNEDDTHLDSKSSYGIGLIDFFSATTITLVGGSDLLCVGDRVFTESNQLLGTIVGILTTDGITVLTFATLPTLTSGTYVFGKKSARLEGGNLRGYTTRFNLTSNEVTRVELFALNSKVIKSFT